MPYSVLIVDDEALTLRTLGRALGDEGFEVFLAVSGEEALQILADEKPDFALLDVVLPAMNGIEVLRQSKVSSPATIILMMSAYHMVDRAVEAMKLGAVDFLEKPFDDDLLLAAVRAALNRDSDAGKRKAELAGIQEKLAELSNRERQVLEGLVAGKANKVIAFDLNISPRTVKQHLRTLFLRAGIKEGRKRVKLATAMFIKEQVQSCHPVIG